MLKCKIKKSSEDFFPEIFLEEIFKITLEVTKEAKIERRKRDKTMVMFHLDRLLENTRVKNSVLKL